MKKIALLLCLLLCFSSAACGKETRPENTIPEDSSDNLVLDVEVTDDSDADAVVEEESFKKNTKELIYYSENLTWALELPEYFRETYGVEDTGYSIRFYDTQNAEAGYGGTLFEIRALSAGEDYEAYARYSFLVDDTDDNGNGYVYIATFPTDLQTNFEDEELMSHYETLSDSLSDWVPAHFYLLDTVADSDGDAR